MESTFTILGFSLSLSFSNILSVNHFESTNFSRPRENLRVISKAVNVLKRVHRGVYGGRTFNPKETPHTANKRLNRRYGRSSSSSSS